MSEILDESVSQRRFQSQLSAAFAGTALLLAALGIYGVVSYSVARRTNEMGVRLALGARPWALRWMVMTQAMFPVAAGLLAGTAAALAVTRLAGALLYDISPHDPATLAGVLILLAAVGLASSWVPARRASAVDPLECLREG